MRIKDKELFLKYAIPCGSVLVKRGKITKSKLNKIKNSVINNKPIKEDLDYIFTIGTRMCYLTAKNMHKTIVDKNVIHKYFWYEHGQVVDWRGKTHKDIPLLKCKVWPAKVLKIIKNKAIVETPIGKREVSLEFLKNIKIGNYITIHYSHACEEISRKDALKLWDYEK